MKRSAGNGRPFLYFIRNMDEHEVKKMLHWQSSFITSTPAIFNFEGKDKSMLPEGVNIDIITIYPIKVGTAQKISTIASDIKSEDFSKITVNQKSSFHPKAPELFEKYSETILEIICLGIHNKKDPYPPYLKEYLKVNSTWEDLHILINAILFRMGTLSFINSTTSLKKVGLLSSTEIIAMQKNLSSWEKN